MKDWPRDPLRQHDRLIAALCDDLLAGHRGLDGPNVTRVAEINRQVSANGDPYGGLRSLKAVGDACRPALPPLTGLGQSPLSSCQHGIAIAEER